MITGPPMQQPGIGMGATETGLGMGAPQASLGNPFPAMSWEQLLMDFDPAELGIIDIDEARRLTEKDIISQLIERREESRRARESLGLEGKWRNYEGKYYLAEYDESKESWQSDLQVPEVYTTIRTAVSLLQGALSEPERFFELVRVNRWTDDRQLRFLTSVLHLIQREAGYLSTQLAVWEEALLLGSGVMKIWLEETISRKPHIEEVPIYQDPRMAQMAAMYGMPLTKPSIMARPRTVQRIRCSKVPLWQVYPDPAVPNFYEGKYVIEESEVFEEDIRDRVESGAYDSMKDIGEPVRMRTSAAGEQSLWSTWADHLTTRRRHLVTDFIGNLYGKNGKIVATNWIVTMVNERAITRMRYNPQWNGKSRYIWSTPIPHQGCVWGRSLIDSDADVQDAVSDLVNLILDDVRYTVLPMMQIDETKIDDLDNYQDVYPGKVFRARGGDAVDKIQFTSQSNGAWPIINFLQGIGDQSTQISEFVDGTPTSRGRPSAMEVASKTAMSTSHVHNLARRLEENDVERAMQLFYEYIMQFGADSLDPSFTALLQEFGGPPELSDEIQRLFLMDVPFRIQVRGISMLLNRDQMLARVMQFLQIQSGLNVPPVNQIKALYIIMSLMGIRPAEFGYQETAEEEEQLMQYMQYMQMMQMQNGGSGMGATAVGSAPNSSPHDAVPGPPNPNQNMNQNQQAQQPR